MRSVFKLTHTHFGILYYEMLHSKNINMTRFLLLYATSHTFFAIARESIG